MAQTLRARLIGMDAEPMPEESLRSFYAADRRSQLEAGKTEERRILGATEYHCTVCPDWAERGWLPIGSNPIPGTHEECFGNCYCHIEYR